MAVLVLTVFMFLVAIRGCESSNFPLADCFTQELDILILHSDPGNEAPNNVFIYLHSENVAWFTKGSSDRSTQRVMLANILVNNNPQVDMNANLSSWSLYSDHRHDYYYNMNLTDKSLEEVLQAKMAFFQRLFSEMSGVRENATHIGVVFLNWTSLSRDEAKNIPEIIGQVKTDIKIFVVVFVTKQIHTNYVINLRDALVLEFVYGIPTDYLTMAMCGHCAEGFPLQHGDGSSSCYTTISLHRPSTLLCATHLDSCASSHCYLVAIETQEELSFLKNSLSEIFMKGLNGEKDWKEDYFHIGLRRNLTSMTKRFHWSSRHPTGNRPLVVNNWMPGKPSAGSTRACAAWKFLWEPSGNSTSLGRSEGRLVEGWVDVACMVRGQTSGLCEVFLPRKVEEKNLTRIIPATNDSFSQALSKENVVQFGDNIVSISTYIANYDFRKFLKEKGRELFPLFDCGVDTGPLRYISYLLVCDGISDCGDGRDEARCVLQATPRWVDQGLFVECLGVFCCDGTCLMAPWVNDGEVDCPVCADYSGKEATDESLVDNNLEASNCIYMCEGDGCFGSQPNNTMIDCYLDDENPGAQILSKLETADTCYNLLGDRLWAPRCVYITDKYGAVLGCRNMSHLKDCAQFKCPEYYFKCPNAYCIPQSYVMDGKNDCPVGEDEDVLNIGPCSGNFACWDSDVCLHPDLVCDGHSDCPHRDDEMDCETGCDYGFMCVSGTVTVSHYNTLTPLESLFFIGFKTKYIDLSTVDLSSLGCLRFTSNPIQTAILSGCKIHDLCIYFFDNPNYALQTLDVSYNEIRTYYGYTMHGLRHLNLSYNRQLESMLYVMSANLEILDLSHTSLPYLVQSQQGFPRLKHLNLSFTLISGFRESMFHSSLILLTLHARGLFIDHFDEEFFNGLTIRQHLYTDRFQMCCPLIRGINIPDNTCHAPDDVISSCFDLIGVSVQRVFLWVVAVLAVLGNMTVIVYRVIWDRSVLRTGYGLFVTNLGISDFIMGVYLLIIAGADYYYRGIYVLYDKRWREGIVCRIAGFLATLSSETSILFVFLITLDRFLVMKFPFGNTKLTMTNKMITLSLSWVTGFLLALTPIVFRFEIYSSNAMCLGLPLSPKWLNGWEFSFGVFIALNFCLCVAIACGQRAIYRAMSENRIDGAGSSASPRRVADIMVAKQLSLVALSNFLCWFPVGCMGLLSLGGLKISLDVYAWTTVLVLPINSAANPLLYTIPVLMDKWDKFKFGDRRPQ